VEKQLRIDASTAEIAASEAEAPEQAAVTETAQGRATVKDFIRLTKPGIIISNLIAAFAGFWIASGKNVEWDLLVYSMLGTALVMASGTVLNNYLDRDMDAKMARTRKRALPSGLLKPNVVLGYGIGLGVVGLTVLSFGTTALAALLGLFGLFVYVWVYTVWFKRTSVWSTFVGAFSGAVPPVIGYLSVENPPGSMGALILFLILFLWQPPHFWALGIMRTEDYRAAGFPLLPVVRGVAPTKVAMLRYVVLLVPVSIMLTVYGYTGTIYLVGATILGMAWAIMGFLGFKPNTDDNKWARKMFVFSINYLTLLLLLMVVDTLV